jgi:serine/threonine-protein kinase
MERGTSTAGTIVVSALVSVAMYLLMHFVVAQRLPVNAVEVPPLVGLSPEQARGLLEPRGLLLVIDGERPDRAVAPGTLSEQRPLGGSRLRHGDEVHAQLARAMGAAKVPAVLGMQPDPARAALADAHLKVSKTTEAPSDTVPRGTLIGTQPPAGTELKPDDAVELIVSGGPSTAAVPKVVGKRLSSAKDVLTKAGFAVGSTRYGSNDDFDQGIVISQNPPAGSQASPGVKVDLVIND